MADSFQLEIATPERQFVNEPVTEAELPGKGGQIGVLPGHAPLLSALGAGVLTYKGGGSENVLAIDGGFLEIFEDHVRVLADHAEFARDIQVDRQRQELERATEALKSVHDAAESDAALRALKKAQAYLEAAEKASGRTQ